MPNSRFFLPRCKNCCSVQYLDFFPVGEKCSVMFEEIAASIYDLFRCARQKSTSQLQTTALNNVQYIQALHSYIALRPRITSKCVDIKICPTIAYRAPSKYSCAIVYRALNREKNSHYSVRYLTTINKNSTTIRSFHTVSV